MEFDLVKLIKPPVKKSGKQERERKVLLCLVDYYIKTAKPVGSNTLKEVGFADLSSATIRNYFAHLEEEGFLMQHHASGGRIPTDKAFRFYAHAYVDTLPSIEMDQTPFGHLKDDDSREVTTFLQYAIEELIKKTHTSAFISAPRFDQDVITAIKVVPVDASRCLCILLTDFGQILTEVIHTDFLLTTLAAKRIESYFTWRITGHNPPDHLSDAEEQWAKNIYNEIMVRYLVNYAHFNREEVYRTGFSRLLNYQEYHDPALLAGSLALFENAHGMQLLLKECSKLNTLKVWIGDDLAPYTPFCQSGDGQEKRSNCAIIAIPYHVHHQRVGAIGILGPTRLPYRYLFDTLRLFSETIHEILTHKLYKFKITIRPPKSEAFKQQKLQLMGQTHRLLIEDMRSS